MIIRNLIYGDDDWILKKTTDEQKTTIIRKKADNDRVQIDIMYQAPENGIFYWNLGLKYIHDNDTNLTVYLVGLND